MAKKKSNGSISHDHDKSTISVTLSGQFIRDMSFENIAAQRKVWTPTDLSYEVQLQIDINNQENRQYLVSMRVCLEAKGGEETAYIMEIDYCGLFQIKNMPESQIQPYLAVQCPHLMFPFVRRIVSDTTRDGGFPAYNMDLINFAAIYEREVLHKQKAGGKSKTET